MFKDEFIVEPANSVIDIDIGIKVKYLDTSKPVIFYYDWLFDNGFRFMTEIIPDVGFLISNENNKEHYLYIKSFHNSEKEEINDIPEDTNYNAEDNEFKHSDKFLYIILIFSIILSSVFNSYTYAAVSGRMQDDTAVYPDFKDIQFKTPTSPITLSPVVSVVNAKGYDTYAYTFDDPRPLTKQVSLSSHGLDSKVNKDVITGILLYKELTSLSDVIKTTGVSVSDIEYEEAVQLSLWREAAKVYTDYTVIETSIKSASVRTLASIITKWSTDKVVQKPKNVTMVDYLLPVGKPEIDTSKANKTVQEDFTIFGPYKVKSKVPAVLVPSVEGGITIGSAGAELKEIKSEETFYVKFPQTFSGTSKVTLATQTSKYSLNYSYNRVWLHREYKDALIEFAVSTVVGSNGTANFSVRDVLTGLPVPGTTLSVKNEIDVIVQEVVTQTDGKQSVELPVGKYKVVVTPPIGFVTVDPIEFEVGFIGDVQNINVDIPRAEGIANFNAIDQATLGNAGYTEVFVYRDEIAVKRLALIEGACYGIVLDPGSYTCIAYKTTGDYSISQPIPFNVKSGEEITVNLELAKSTPNSTISIEDTLGKVSWRFSLFTTDGTFLFSITNNGETKLRLPIGNYVVKAASVDNSLRLPPTSIVVGSDLEQKFIIPTIVGTEIVNIFVVDSVAKLPIPFVTIGILDDEFNLITTVEANDKGVAQVDSLVLNNVYRIVICAAPNNVSGYSANGNTFLARARDIEIELYSLEEIQTVTKEDTIYRVPNLTYNYAEYDYPTEAKIDPNKEVAPVTNTPIRELPNKDKIKDQEKVEPKVSTPATPKVAPPLPGRDIKK